MFSSPNTTCRVSYCGILKHVPSPQTLESRPAHSFDCPNRQLAERGKSFRGLLLLGFCRTRQHEHRTLPFCSWTAAHSESCWSTGSERSGCCCRDECHTQLQNVRGSCWSQRYPMHRSQRQAFCSFHERDIGKPLRARQQRPPYDKTKQ